MVNVFMFLFVLFNMTFISDEITLFSYQLYLGHVNVKKVIILISVKYLNVTIVDQIFNVVESPDISHYGCKCSMQISR